MSGEYDGVRVVFTPLHKGLHMGPPGRAALIALCSLHTWHRTPECP